MNFEQTISSTIAADWRFNRGKNWQQAIGRVGPFVIAIESRVDRATARVSVPGITDLNGTVLERFGDLDPIDLATALQGVHEFLKNVYDSIEEVL